MHKGAIENVDEDGFDRALRRERDLRDRLASGDVDEDELNVLRDFADAVSTDMQLTLAQARRLVDEGVDPAVVAAIVRHFPLVALDAAIDLAVDYGLELSCVLDLVGAGAPRDLAETDLGAMFDNEISPELLRFVVAAGFPAEPVRVALELCERLCDPTDTLDALQRAQLTGLTVDQIATIADYEINPRVVRRLLDGDDELDVDGAIRLLLGDDDDERIEKSRPNRNVGFAVGRDRRL